LYYFICKTSSKLPSGETRRAFALVLLQQKNNLVKLFEIVFTHFVVAIFIKIAKK